MASRASSTPVTSSTVAVAPAWALVSPSSHVDDDRTARRGPSVSHAVVDRVARSASGAGPPGQSSARPTPNTTRVGHVEALGA